MSSWDSAQSYWSVDPLINNGHPINVISPGASAGFVNLEVDPNPNRCHWISGGGNWSDPSNWANCNGTTPQPNDIVYIDTQETVNIDFTADITIKDLITGDRSPTISFSDNVIGGDVVNSYKLIISDDLVLNNEAIITHSFNGTAESHAVSIEANNISISENAKIDVTSMGYDKNFGPGKSTQYYSGYHSFVAYGGGSHGGIGGVGSWSGGGSNGSIGPVYGSAENPATYGSGGNGAGAGAGGGVIMLTVNNTLTLNGEILANGGDGTDVGNWGGVGASAYGGGAGGSINIDADTIVNSGRFEALGGFGPTPRANAGSGGGGRIRIDYNNPIGSFDLSVESARNGESGSIYGPMTELASLISTTITPFSRTFTEYEVVSSLLYNTEFTGLSNMEFKFVNQGDPCTAQALQEISQAVSLNSATINFIFENGVIQDLCVRADFYEDSYVGEYLKIISNIDVDPDYDSDSVDDDFDNCPIVENSDQLNSDLDSFGDVCDVCATISDEGQEDTDGDGFGDS
jgi:hypothetical protein